MFTNWKYITALILILGSFLGGEIQGRLAVHKDWDLANAKNTIQVDHISAKDQATVDAAGQKFAEMFGKTKVVTQKILVKVPVYVTKEDDSKCTINSGFVSLWNANNQMSVPSDPGQSASQASGVKLSDVAAQHTVESGYTHELEDQLNAAIDVLTQLKDNHK